MPRAQYIVECLSALFTEKRSGLARRKADHIERVVSTTNGNGTKHANGNAFPKACRWIQIDGKTVRFSQGVGPFQGHIHVHHLPSQMVARAFAVALLKTDEDGYPAPLDPEEWASWQAEYDRY